MLLDVKNLNVAYGDATAIWDISIQVEAGAIVSIVGPNGAGKSTLINSIAGILRPQRGKILLEGIDVSTLPGHEVCGAGIAIVPEGRRLFTQMSVIDNLELGAYRFSGEKNEAALAHVFDLFPILKERKNQIAGSMSGGQQQMVAIGRALMARPKLLLMDEPSLGLSPVVVQDMFKIIKTINESGVSVLLVEQNIHKALELADYAYVLEQGKIASSGESKILLNDSKIREVYLGI